LASSGNNSYTDFSKYLVPKIILALISINMVRNSSGAFLLLLLLLPLLFLLHILLGGNREKVSSYFELRIQNWET